jgi:hypothetical protein
MAPALVCLQWCDVTPAGVGLPHVVDEREALALLECWLADPDVHLIGAETSYDVLCAVTSATETERGIGSPERGHRLLTAFVEAYEANRVTDILVRQKLIDLARGCYRYERGENDTTVGFNEYSLAGLSRRLCNIELDKDTFWRKNYHTLRGIPVSAWPVEAVSYAANDSTSTGCVWLAQWKPSVRIAQNFPGKNVSDALADEFNQCRAALWIKAMSVYGLRTDPIALGMFEQYIKADYVETVDELLASGLARRDYHVDANAARAYIVAKGLHVGMPMSEGVNGLQPKLGAAERAEYGRRDKALQCLITPWAEYEAAHAAGLVTVSEHRNTKIALDRMKAWHTARGSVPAVTKDGLRRQKQAKSRATPGMCTDKDGKNPVAYDPWQYVALDKDACQTTDDPILHAYAEMTHLAKIISTDLPRLHDGTLQPIHSHFEPILETGRTSSSNPNVQNQARGKKDRIGARECFVPRAGKVLIDSDYSMLELHTLAQACLWMLGYSTLADELNKPTRIEIIDGQKIEIGPDPHTKVGAAIHGVSYEEGQRLKAIKDPAFDNDRNCAKPLNFGKPGGLGADSLMSFAAKGYGVKKDLGFWQQQIKVWSDTWLEMPAYFDAISALEGKSGRYNVVQPWSKRLRAGATYCSACNSIFQGLGADVAKLAGWYLFKACYIDRTSPLYGARIVLFVHDQFMIEIDEDKAVAGARETERLMNLAGAVVLPNCPVKCEPILARRYSKLAKKMKDTDGNLTAWEDLRIVPQAA